MRLLTLSLGLLLVTVGCSNRQLVGTDQYLDCATVADCPVNPGASCAQTCKDGSNPCGNACTNKKCMPRGCPAEADMGGNGASCNQVSDCPINTGASCAQVCPDGSNPCVNACTNHQCAQRGCPGTDGGATTDGGNGTCQPNSGACTFNSECCSGNCITRTSPGFCCVAGGCP
jgi:hypothetical protein